MRTGALLMAVFLIAAAWVYHPVAATDLDDLIPVETLWITVEEGSLAVNGKDVSGKGGDWQSAMEDLEASAEGTVFLQTVDRIVVSEKAANCLKALREDERLRPSIRLYLLRGAADESLDAFTAAHGSEATVENGKEPPLILEEEGRYRLAGAERRSA